jgi:integrating conjugative element protein (TIGR03758 family)
MSEFALGSGVEAETLLAFIASLVAAVALVWTAWVGWGEFESFAEGRTSALAMIGFIARAVVLLLMLLFFIR